MPSLQAVNSREHVYWEQGTRGLGDPNPSSPPRSARFGRPKVDLIKVGQQYIMDNFEKLQRLLGEDFRSPVNFIPERYQFMSEHEFGVDLVTYDRSQFATAKGFQLARILPPLPQRDCVIFLLPFSTVPTTIYTTKIA